MLLEQILASDNLQRAWKRVKQNKGAAGVDGLTIDQYLDWATVHWGTVNRGLEGGYYCPLPVKRVEIPKHNGGIRLLGIPSVNDRVIQQAITQILQPIILEKSVECGIIVQATGFTVLSKNLSFTHSVKQVFFGSAVESVACAGNHIQLIFLGSLTLIFRSIVMAFALIGLHIKL